MDKNEIISHLNKIDNISDAAHITSFSCYRKAESGGDQKVIFDVLDYGPAAEPTVRYMCRVTREDGKTAYGSTAESVDVAISLVILKLKQLDE